MRPPELVVVSSRPSFPRHITSLLGPCTLQVRRFPSLAALSRGDPSPSPILADVQQLAARNAPQLHKPMSSTCRCLFLVGWRSDSDQIIRAWNAGFPVSILEDLSAESLQQMASALEPGTPPIYRQMGSLTAARMGDVVARDRSTSGLTRRELRLRTSPPRDRGVSPSPSASPGSSTTWGSRDSRTSASRTGTV